MRALLFIAILFLSSCSFISENMPDGWFPTVGIVVPFVYEGEYVIETSKLNAQGPWCPWAEGVSSCVVSYGAGSYVIERTQNGVLRVKKEGVSSLSKEPTPYNEADDLCKTEFKDFNCSPNFRVEALKEPNDMLFKALWGLKNIKAPEAWNVKTSAKGVKISVIDSGVKCDHQDLKCSGQYDAITKSNSQKDDNGHGTHVAGTICATGNNRIGLTGAAWDCDLLAAKFLTANGAGSLFDAIEAIEWSVKNGAKVINASWGCTNCYSAVLKTAIERARDAGVLFVTAAGNDGTNNDGANKHYPSDYDVSNIISVASINSQDKLSDFSNYGKKNVDLAAPGEGILSSWNDGNYRSISGTSMAAPHVAAAAALIMSRGVSMAEAKSRILTQARKLNVLDGKVVTGATLNLAAALAGSCNESKYKKCKQKCRKRYGCKCVRQEKCKEKCKEVTNCEG